MILLPLKKNLQLTLELIEVGKLLLPHLALKIEQKYHRNKTSKNALKRHLFSKMVVHHCVEIAEIYYKSFRKNFVKSTELCTTKFTLKLFSRNIFQAKMNVCFFHAVCT